MFWWRVVFIAYAALASILLLVPDPLQWLGLKRYSQTLSAGRGQHAAIFFGLAIFNALARWPLTFSGQAALLVGYGLLTEAIQSFIPSRQPDWWDVAENLAGLALGTVAYEVVTFLRRGHAFFSDRRRGD